MSDNEGSICAARRGRTFETGQAGGPLDSEHHLRWRDETRDLVVKRLGINVQSSSIRGSVIMSSHDLSDVDLKHAGVRSGCDSANLLPPWPAPRGGTQK